MKKDGRQDGKSGTHNEMRGALEQTELEAGPVAALELDVSKVGVATSVQAQNKSVISIHGPEG